MCSSDSSDWGTPGDRGGICKGEEGGPVSVLRGPGCSEAGLAGVAGGDNVSSEGGMSVIVLSPC